MKCTYCGMYLENVDEESPNGMAHTIKCQTKRIHELENEKAAQNDKIEGLSPEQIMLWVGEDDIIPAQEEEK